MMPFIMSSPPPIDDCEEEEDDEFGNFRVADHTFSLTDLNQTNDSPEIEKSWVESSTQNQDELPNISSSNHFQNEVCIKATSDGLTNTTVNPLGNHLHLQEINRLTSETSHRLFSESENLQLENDTVIKNFLLKPQMNKVNVNPQSVAIDKNEENVFDKEISEIVFPFSINKIEDTRTGELESNKRNSSDVMENVLENVCDDFSEFTDFNSGSNLSKSESLSIKKSENLAVSPTQVQDDFDDFDDFESAKFTLYTVKEEPTVEETLKILFGTPKVANEVTVDTAGLTDSLHSCLDDSSSVWGHLKELETSHALSYQWSNSATNKIFLSSLNVDCRNIFFGARWNLCVPRFAANLGVNPLEPVKATMMNSTNLASASSTAEDLVPAAQFDWTNSGLTNPLDASHLTLLDLDFFTKFDDVSSSSYAALSLWNHSSLEKEITATSAKGPTMQTMVESLEGDTVKPIVDDIFGSICDEIVDKEEDEVAETMTLHPTISSVSESNQRKKDEISAEAYAIVESFPDLSFLSARKLMLAAEENMSRWRLRP